MIFNIKATYERQLALYQKKLTVFENHRKSLIQHCERKAEAYGQIMLPDR